MIEKGWGERHPLSGARAIGIPKEYIGIYAPRDEEELAIVEKIVIAAVSYMTGQADIQH